MELSIKSKEFINKYVLPKMKLKEISDDNLEDIVQFIMTNYEVPMEQAEEAGEKIDNAFLELACSVITEITNDPNW